MKNNNPIQIEVLEMNPLELQRAPEAQETLSGANDETTDQLNKSFERFGRRINNAVAVKCNHLPNNPTYVVDGWAYVEYRCQNDPAPIPITLITVDDQETLSEVMITLQTSRHNSLFSSYLMIKFLYHQLSKGRGFRSDLHSEDLTMPENSEQDVENRKKNIYQRIGEIMLISGTKVKHVLKIGNVNPLHFDRIEKGRYSIYGAYLDCISDEKGEMPAPPAIKLPTYYSSSTQLPQFSESTTTAISRDQDSLDASEGPEEMEHDSIEEQTDIVNTEDPRSSIVTNNENTDFILVLGICQCCGQETKIKINRNQIK